MIKPEDIPPEVVEAAFVSFTTGLRDTWRQELCDAIAAALNAWPGVSRLHRDWDKPHIILPVPQKETSE